MTLRTLMLGSGALLKIFVQALASENLLQKRRWQKYQINER